VADSKKPINQTAADEASGSGYETSHSHRPISRVSRARESTSPWAGKTPKIY
jgi:hypothetical protein